MKTKSIDKLSAWLLKQGYPTRPVEWCITPVTGGNIAQDAWQLLADDGGVGFQLPLREEDIDYLPSGMKLSFRLVEGKTICHAIFHFNNTRIRAAQAKQARVESDNSNVQSGQAMIPPEIVLIKLELAEKETRIAKRQEELSKWESDLRDLDIDLRKTTGLAIATNSKLEDRSKSLDERAKFIQDNLKIWEQHIKEMEDVSITHIDEIRGRDDTISELSQKVNISASFNLLINRIANAYMLGKVKKFEDLPPEQIEQFQKYLIHIQQRQFFKDSPSQVMEFGNMFTNLVDSDKIEFSRGIIKWVIGTNPGLIREMAEECKRDEQEAREQTEQEASAE